MLLGYVKDSGLIVGTEDMMEAAVPEVDYSEGLMGTGFYRHKDHGYRMTTMYRGNQIEKKVIKYQMDGKYRVPLWELVYHDCVVAYWYWGDSSNCCPEYIKNRDLLNALYGTPPLYSLDMTQWDENKEMIKESYDRSTEVAYKVFYDEMLSFEYITPDKTIQKTSFANGISVIANFSEIPYVLENGRIIPPIDKIIYENNKTGDGSPSRQPEYKADEFV
jgi:hypothetical protein